MKNKGALVVFSGGQDSTTCLVWALKKFKVVKTICFDYGQRHHREIDAAKKIAKKLNIDLKVMELDLFKKLTKNALLDHQMEIVNHSDQLPSTFVDGRNHIFLSLAAIYAKSLGFSDLVTGVCQTDYSGYPDCREDFVKSLQQTLSLAMDFDFRIHTPLMFLTKAETVKLMEELEGIELLKYSQTCYEGREFACGKCPACKLRLKGFQDAGIVDPLEYQN